MDQFLQSLYQQFDLLRTQSALLQQNIKGISELILLNGGTIPVNEKPKSPNGLHDLASGTSGSSHADTKKMGTSSHNEPLFSTSSHEKLLKTATSSHVQSEENDSSHEMDNEFATASLESLIMDTSSHISTIKRSTSSYEAVHPTINVLEIPEKIIPEKVVAPVITDLFSQPSPLPPHTTYEAFMAMQALEKTPQQDMHDLRNNPIPPYTEDYDNRPVPAMYQVPKEYNEKMMWTEKILYALNELRLPATAHQVASAIHGLEPDSNLSIEKSVELTTSRMFKNKIINAKKEKNKNYYYLYYYSK
jgi:hypothetical protein